MLVHTPTNPSVLTAAGRRDLQQRLDRTLEQLTHLSERMRAGERGPEEMAEHRQLVTQVEELTAILQGAADVGSVDEDPSIVELGDEVDVEMPDGEVDTWALVHAVEANHAAGRMSVASPLGRALLGARPGDRVAVEAPAGTYECTVRARRRLS
jgi:transcription elongation GreA/GreB family factor